MNYFAHGMRFVDRPYFLAGTAIPDWLSAADRRVRMRSTRVQPFLAEASGPEAEVAAGVLQHLHDDRWFHTTQGFNVTCAEMATLFREELGPEDGFRPGFLGHIVTEMLLDGVLIARDPELLDRYYAAIEQIEPERIECTVNGMAARTTSRLAMLIEMFRREQFLRDYLEPARMLFRLNQVMRRVKLNALPPEIERVIETGWSLVERQVHQLLPAESFAPP